MKPTLVLVVEKFTGRPAKLVDAYTAMMWTSTLRVIPVVFPVVFVGSMILSWWRLGELRWYLVLVMATLITAYCAAKSHSEFRARLRLRFFQIELTRRRQYRIARRKAVHELVDSMARLSPGDLSIFAMILRMEGSEDVPAILSSQGSPNHHVLVQMSDLRLARPGKFQTMGKPPHSFTSVSYEITAVGLDYLAKLLPYVMWHRSQLRDENDE